MSVKYVIDGSNIALFGRRSKSEARQADLRRVLALCCELAFNEDRFVCYFDASIPFDLPLEQKDLLDLLVTCHGLQFKIVPSGTAADDYALEKANSTDAAVITHDTFKNKPHYRDRYSFLGDPERHLRPLLEDMAMNVPGIGIIEFQERTSFEFYSALMPFLPQA